MKILPMYLQQEKSDCGQACIAMVASYFGHEIDLQSLRALVPTSKGMTLYEMRALCTRLHLTAEAVRVELDGLNRLTLPAILHWDMSHFVVLKKVSKHKIWIHDPAVGVRTSRFDEVSRSFTGVVLTLEPTETFEVMRLKGQLGLLDFVKGVKGHVRSLLFLLGIALAVESAFLLQPLFMEYVTDFVVGGNDNANLYALSAGMILLLCFVVALDYLKGRCVLYLSTTLQTQWSFNTMRHLLKLPLAYFEKRHIGNIQLAMQAMDDIQRKMGVDLLHVLLDGVLLLVNGCVMVTYSPFLSLLVGIGLFLVMLLRYVSYHTLQSQRQQALNQQGQASSSFIETIQSILPIKSFSKEASRFSLWRSAYVQALNAEVNVSKLQLCYQAAQQLVMHVETVLLVCVGAGMIVDHRFSLGMLVAFLSYRLVFVNKAGSMIQHFFDYRLLSVPLERVRDMILEAPEVISEGRIVKKESVGALEIRELSFAYEINQAPVIQQLSFHVAAGEKLAIIGPSGCGKTTLLKIMMGLLRPDLGEIFFDGLSLSQLGLAQYRRYMGSVMQEDRLLSGSIRDNITFFEEAVDMDYVEEVAKLSAIHETIMDLPMGYATRLGEMGSLLSGGQRQRVLLARALYKRPKILFLDEATSHLDVAAERQINVALKQLSITQVIVAHRPETIAMADRIFVLGEKNA